MIYLDSSVILAAVLAEARRPRSEFWLQEMASSQLATYEVWNRLHVRHAAPAAQAEASAILDALYLMSLDTAHLQRALHPFPLPVRTLDGLHLASLDWLRESGLPVQLATYDRRLAQEAEAMGFACYTWP